MKTVSRVIDWIIGAIGLFMIAMGVYSLSGDPYGVRLGLGLGLPLLLVCAWRILRRRLYPERRVGVSDWLLYVGFLFALLLFVSKPTDPMGLSFGLCFALPLLLLYLWRQFPRKSRTAPPPPASAGKPATRCACCGAASTEEICPYCGMPKR